MGPPQALTNWQVRHRGFLILVALVLIVAGGFAVVRTPVALFPQVDFPRIAVAVDCGDRSAELMVTQVTIPVENALHLTPGVRSIRSTTSRGSAEFNVSFDWGRDMAQAMLQAQAALSQQEAAFPAGTEISVRRLDPTVFPALGYSLVSDSLSAAELRDVGMFKLRPALSAIDGVARVEVLGGEAPELQVAIDPSQLAAHGMTAADVSSAITDANSLISVGRVEDRFKLYLVLGGNATSDAASIRDVVVRAGPRGIVRVGDVASVSMQPAPTWTRVTADGHDAVLVQVYQQRDANTVAIAGAIADALPQLRSQLPPGVTIANWYDQSQLIKASAVSLRDAVVIGTLLAAGVLLLFLRSLPLTIVAVASVPGVLVVTALVLWWHGQSFNLMTLGGMAAAVGLVIDDTIVMLEHIVKRLRTHADDSERTNSRRARGIFAARDFARPLLGASLATIIIHVPPAFMSGVAGEFFKALSFTIAVSLVISFLGAWLVIPSMSDWLLTDRTIRRPDQGPIFAVVSRAYSRAISLLLRHRWKAGLPVSCVLTAALLVSAWLLYPELGTGFMPTMDEGGFVLDYHTAPGMSLTETDRLLKQVEGIIQATPEVQTYSRRTGLQLGGGLTEANEGDFFIQLKHGPRRDIEEVMDDVRTRVERDVPGVQIELIQLMEDLIGDLTGVPQPIEVKVYSENPAELQHAARAIAEKLPTLPIGGVPAGALVEVNDGLHIAGDALEIRVDPLAISGEGLDPAGVMNALTPLIDGSIVAQVKDASAPRLLAVRVGTPRLARSRIEQILAQRIPAPDGHMVELSRIAELVTVIGQPQIVRENQRRMVAVTARTSGVDLGSAARAVEQMLATSGITAPAPGAPPLPHALGGLLEQQRESFRSLSIVFVGAVGLLFLLLTYWYRSLWTSAVITLVGVLAAPAVVIGLWLTETELNVSSMMGLAMVVGSVVEAAMFLVSHAAGEDQPEHGLSAGPGSGIGSAGMPPIAVAAAERLRPIMMTTIAATLAMAPLALGLGEGAALLRPLAITIMSGLIAQLPLVLIVLPTLLRPGNPAKTN